MRFNRTTRRMFLQGAGGALLAIPFLPSLVGDEAKAATADNLKYLQVIENMGALREDVRPPSQFVPTQELGVDANTKARPLAEVIAGNGKISTIYGEGWNDVASKINVVSNYHGYSANGNHHTCGATTGSGLLPGLDSVEQAEFPYSLDWVIGRYLYPTGSDQVLRVNLGENGKYAQSHCFAGERKNLPLTCSTFEQLSARVAPTRAPTVDTRRVDMLSRIMDDYRQVANNPRLSQLDRDRFSAYTDQIADVQRREQQVQSCSVDQLDNSANYRIRHENALATLAQSFACGVTRLASYVLIDFDDVDADVVSLHTHHHDHGDIIQSIVRWRADIVAKLVKALDTALDETGQSVLDTMVFYHGREYAHALNSTGNAHSTLGYTAIIGGKAGGRLQTGNYLDAGGAPTGRILMTLMKAMGLPVSAIERDERVGFGEYSTGGLSMTTAETAPFLTTSGKRKALPIVTGYDSDG